MMYCLGNIQSRLTYQSTRLQMVYRTSSYTDFTRAFFYFQNTTWFHSTDVNVISFMPIRKGTPLCQLSGNS